FLVPIPFIVGLVLRLFGNSAGNAGLVRVGAGLMAYGTPAIMFILIVVAIVMMMTGKLTDKKPDVTFGESQEEPAEENQESEKEREENAIEDINSSYGYESRMKLAEYQMEHVADAYANANKGTRIKGWLFFGFLMTDFALCMIFVFLNIMLGFFICLGIFAGTILISIIVVVILQKTSMSGRISYGKYDTCSGIVKACVLSSMGSTGGSHANSTVRVNSVTYLVIIVVDGKEYNAYSSGCYCKGDKLTVAVKRNGRGVAKIIGPTPEKAAQWRAEREKRQKFIAELDEKTREFEEWKASREESEGKDEEK
ncbi:MAG: hypothetical protein K2H78_03010, partial [Clostridia bacterium]|nr:hypothetical protein [Clostridia bacterium]